MCEGGAVSVRDIELNRVHVCVREVMLMGVTLCNFNKTHQHICVNMIVNLTEARLLCGNTLLIGLSRSSHIANDM